MRSAVLVWVRVFGACLSGYNRAVHPHGQRRLPWVSKWAELLVGYSALVGCTSVTPALTSPAVVPTPVAFTVTPSPAPSPAATPAQSGTPLNLHPQVQVLATNLPGPDDLLLMPDGSILVSDVQDGTIKRYGTDGQLRVVVSGLDEPEGMALAPDRSLIIAEQGNNRLVRYDFASQTLSPFLDLVNHTANPGVDNIIGNEKRLIVPDSPNGTLLEVSWDGRTVRQLASGLVRPTGAWLESDGSILIADEYGNALLRLRTDGALEKLADFSVPDDVVADASGNIFVATLGDGAIHLLPAGQSKDVVLVGGLGEPQGLILDADGNLVITDPGHHDLIKVIVH